MYLFFLITQNHLLNPVEKLEMKKEFEVWTYLLIQQISEIAHMQAMRWPLSRNYF